MRNIRGIWRNFASAELQPLRSNGSITKIQENPEITGSMERERIKRNSNFFFFFPSWISLGSKNQIPSLYELLAKIVELQIPFNVIPKLPLDKNNETLHDASVHL